MLLLRSLLLASCLFLPVRAENAPGLFGLSSPGEEESSVLYRIDPVDGRAVAIGPVGYPSCAGLDFHADGRLFAACLGPAGDNRPLIIVEIDPSSGAGAELGRYGPGAIRSSYAPFAGSVNPSSGSYFIRGAGFLDFGGVPAAGAFSIRFDPPDGTITDLPRDLIPGQAMSFGPGSRLITASTQRTIVTPGLLTDFFDVNLESEQATKLSGPVVIDVVSLDHHPVAGLLYGTDGPSLYTVQPESAEIGDRVTLEIGLDSIAWQPSLTQDLVLPNLVSTEATGSVHFETEVTFLNLSATPLEVSVFFFGDNGEEPLSSGSPVGRADALSLVVPIVLGGEEHVRVPFDSGFEGGWALVTSLRVDDLQASAGLFFKKENASGASEMSRIVTGLRFEAQRTGLEFRGLVQPGAGLRPAVSLVNPSPTQSATVEIFLGASSQTLIAECVVLPRRQQKAFLVDIFENRTPDCQTSSSGGFSLGGDLRELRIRSDIPITASAVDVSFPSGQWIPVPLSRIDPK